MKGDTRAHLLAGGILALLALIVVVFWSFPKLVVFILLGVVAVLMYGALYLIIAAWVDPKVEAPLPTTGGNDDETIVAPSDDQGTVVQPARPDPEDETLTRVELEDAATEAAHPAMTPKGKAPPRKKKATTKKMDNAKKSPSKKSPPSRDGDIADGGEEVTSDDSEAP